MSVYFNIIPKQQIKHATRLIQLTRNIGHEFAKRAKDQKIRRSSIDLVQGPRVALERRTVALQTLRRLYCTTRAQHDSAESEDPAVAGEASNSEDVDGFSLKSLLYKEEDDLIHQLNATKNSMELMDMIAQSVGKMQRHHYVQSVILLRMFNLKTNDESSADENVLILDKLLEGIRQHITSMDINELSCCYLYLRRMGTPNAHNVMQALLLQALHLVETSDQFIPLPALSRLAVGVGIGREFYTPMVCQNFIRHILEHVSKCSTAEEVRLLAICFLHIQPLIDDNILNAFKLRIRQLLDNGELNGQTEKSIIKLLQMLNLMVWSRRNAILIRDLLMTLRDRIAELNESDLKTVCRMVQYHYEPAGLLEPSKKAAESLLQNHQSPDTLACFMAFAEPTKREPLVKKFRSLIMADESWQEYNASSNFFTILRSLKIADVKLCNEYWDRVVKELDSNPDEAKQLRFLRHCHRYMNFNNNLGGTYRHADIEKRLSRLAMSAIDGELPGRLPDKFARLASFIMAYGHTPYSWKKFPNTIISQIISMADQFSISDCFLLSRGLHIALELRYRHSTPPLVGMQLSTIDSILIAATERHLNNNLSASDLILIVRTLSYRKSLKNSSLYQKAFEKFKEIDYSAMDSRTLRDLSYVLSASNFIIPKAMEAMFDYIDGNYEHVMGETMEKLLSCAYNLGYVPQSETVLQRSAEILMRDFNYMSGLSIVQACLALCFYKASPTELIDRVFCVKFIQRIEDEIQMCYSKATYPERVLNLVMQLNRTVCLDFPEANVPWFQQNYLEAQLSKKPFAPSVFKDNVRRLLEVVLKDETYFRCNHTTPYGYQIDFVIHFDRDKKPMPAPAETTMLDRITKVAILLMKLDSFCENDLTALRGPESLKVKHLEMMGYKVLHINEHDWNSKYMNAPGAKANYLKCLLQISN